MGIFLGRDAFGGDAGNEPVASGAPLAGQARFNGAVLFLNWSRRDVEAVLPADVTLAANSLVPAMHPVVFIVGEQTEGALIFGGFTIPTGIRYEEVAIAVPFVRCGRDPALHIYIPRIYSSYFPAVWNGNVHYGFAKRLARIGSDGAAVVVTEDGAPLLRAELTPAGDWLSGAHCSLAHFEAMCAVFALPVLGRRGDGRYVRSRFEWGFEDAAVRRIGGHVSIEASLGQGLTPRRCPVDPEGGFEVRGMLWRLTWPVSGRT
jgi:hypothetical protein